MKPVRNIRLDLAFDGSAYHGWQVQKGLPTVQGTVIEAIRRITGEQVALIGSGRTDAGTHARAYVANFRTTCTIPTDGLVRALNGVLPPDIRVMSAREVPLAFHARRDARSKVYRYRVYLGPVLPPHLARECFHCPWRLDLEKMCRAAGLFEGTHDFASFAAGSGAATAAGNTARGTVRTIFRCRLAARGRLMTITVEGDGFLHHMVRNMAGTLIEVGSGRMTLREFRTLFGRRDRRCAGFTAPAHGRPLGGAGQYPPDPEIPGRHHRGAGGASGRGSCRGGRRRADLLPAGYATIAGPTRREGRIMSDPETPERDGTVEARLLKKIDRTRLPAHVAVIMDGNGRWACARNLPRVAGHRAGIGAVREVVEAAARLGIRVLTLYAFSRENWKRPRSEVRTLMSLLKEYVRRELDTLARHNIRLQTIGRIHELEESVRRALDGAVRKTQHNTGMVLNVALNYSGRAELVDAFNRMREELERDGGSIQIGEETISGHLYTAGLPDPDLLIRTSGELRLSNFLLWQIAYAEIYVTPTLWPDFRRRHFYEAVLEYQRRHRRYGGI